MNIIEATKSGKPFRRPEFDSYLRCMPELHWVNPSNLNTRSLFESDLLADDWEVLVCEKHNYTSDIAEDINCYDCMTEYSYATQGPDAIDFEDACKEMVTDALKSQLPTSKESIEEIPVTEVKLPHTCKHDWKVYMGLEEKYEYCTKCDTKREAKDD